MAMSSDLMRGVVEPIVLRLVSEKAMYGYEIIKMVNEKTENRFAWKEGTLYPCLHRLENDGLISSEWVTEGSSRPRKYYAITGKGAKVLSDKANEWREFSDSVNVLLFAAQ